MEVPATNPQNDATTPIGLSHTGTHAPWAAMEQRRLAAIMFTDMVGYSALTHENEPLALELVERHNGLLRQRFVEHGGREIKAMGDGFLVVFASALEAVRCAVAIQSAVHERNAVEPQERAFHVRIGIHVGDVVHRGDDVFGQGVNTASRLERLARPGGICLSEQAANLIRNTIDQPMIKLGKAALKNIQTPVGVYHIRLPWEERRAPLFDRVSFFILQRKTPSFADLTSAAFIATVAGLAIWQSATHKAIHAVVWFGEDPPGEARLLDKPRAATLSLTDATLGRNSASSSGGVIVPASIAGAASSRARLFQAVDRSVGMMPLAQPERPALSHAGVCLRGTLPVSPRLD